MASILRGGRRVSPLAPSTHYIIALIFGFTLLNIWSDVIGHTSAFDSAAALLSGQLSNGRMLFSSGLCASSLLCAILCETVWQHRGSISLVSAILGALASTLYFLSPTISGSSAAVAAMSAFAVGAVYGWLEVRLLSLSMCQADISASKTLWCLAASLVLKTIVSGAVGMAPDIVQATVLVLCPPVISLFSIRTLSHHAGNGERDCSAIRNRREARNWLCFLLLGAILSAVARAVSNLGYWGASNPVDASVVMCTLLSTPLFLGAVWITLVRPKGSVSGLALGLFILLTGFLAIEFTTTSGPVHALHAILTTSVELYGHMLFWGLIVLSMGRMGMHPYRVVGAAEGAMSASAVALAILLVGVEGSERTLIAASLYAAAVVALFLFKRINAEAEELEEHLENIPQDRLAPTGPSTLPGYTLLTQRERDVCALLAQGRDRSYIASTLNLSEGTVKTHIQHVYQKLCVHSKQELITLVETSQSTVAPASHEQKRGQRNLPID